jgi:hypothetical protein
MKNATVTGSVALVLLATACSFNASTDRAPPRQPPPGYQPGYASPGYGPGYGQPGYNPQGYQQPGYGQPQQPGYPPPQPQYAPQPGGPQPGYNPQAGGPQPGGPQPGFQPAPTHVAPGVASFPEPVNLAAIQAISSRNPKACGFLEVAPGVWTRVDCHAYSPATKSIAHLSPRKSLAITHHTAQWKPLRFFGGGFQQALAQGFSKSIFQKAPNQVQRGVLGGGPTITADPPPAAVDHRTQGLEGPIKDQGPVGACTAFSLSAAIDNAAIRAGKMQVGQPTQASSANHVWAAYGFPQMGAAADATLGRTIAPMSLWGQSHAESCKIANPIIGDCADAVTPRVVPGSFRSDPALVAKSDRADQGGLYRVAAFEKLETQPMRTEQVIQTLASGGDLWIALKIDGFAWSNSKMRQGVIPDWNDTNGGHAVTMVGYRETPQGKQFLVHNSWGTSWGDGGYGWVSEAMLNKWMHFAYKVKLTDGVKEPTDDDCAADEMLDLVTGRCAAICPDNTRPSNGCAGQPGALVLPPGFPPIPGFTPPAPAK